MRNSELKIFSNVWNTPNALARQSPNLNVRRQGCGWLSTCELCTRGGLCTLWLHHSHLKGSLQVLVHSDCASGRWQRPERAGLTEGTGKAGEWSHPIKAQVGLATTPLLPILQRKRPRPPVVCKTLQLFSDTCSRLADLSSCSPPSLTGSLPFLANIKHSPLGLWTCWSSARKSLPESCTAHSSFYLGLCSHVTIGEVPWPCERAAPPPRRFHPSPLPSFLCIHSFIHSLCVFLLSPGCRHLLDWLPLSPVRRIVFGALALKWWALIHLLNKWRKKLLNKWRKVLHIPHSEMKRSCHKINMYL